MEIIGKCRSTNSVYFAVPFVIDKIRQSNHKPMRAAKIFKVFWIIVTTGLFAPIEEAMPKTKSIAKIAQPM